jgi:predicted anti-sigma-YlaC factor YlaD
MISLMCERARRWANLRVDGELSELEQALLDAHLARCGACLEFAEGVHGVAEALTSAPLVQPHIEVALPRSRRALALRSTALAATIACVGAAVAAFGQVGDGGAARAVKPVAMVASADTTNELRALRRAALVRANRRIPRNRQVPGESV